MVSKLRSIFLELFNTFNCVTHCWVTGNLHAEFFIHDFDNLA